MIDDNNENFPEFRTKIQWPSSVLMLNKIHFQKWKVDIRHTFKSTAGDNNAHRKDIEMKTKPKQKKMPEKKTKINKQMNTPTRN